MAIRNNQYFKITEKIILNKVGFFTCLMAKLLAFNAFAGYFDDAIKYRCFSETNIENIPKVISSM